MARTDLKGYAELRLWELNKNSTRYDKLLAAPSDEQLVKYWKGWAALSLPIGVFVLLFLIGILSSRNARKGPFVSTEGSRCDRPHCIYPQPLSLTSVVESLPGVFDVSRCHILDRMWQHMYR
jgi:hypothetical protein